MRRRRAKHFHRVCLTLIVGALVLLPWVARAGGPYIVGGYMGLEGVPFTWNPSVPVPYRVDGGPFAATWDGTVTVNNATGLQRVQAMFKVWQDVPTASITFSYAGPIQSTGIFSDGNVDTVEEYNAVIADCNEGNQSPVMFDADGSLFTQLTGEPTILGFAGPCAIDHPTGRILSAMGMFNGRTRDGVYEYPNNYEMTAAEMDEVLAHEFGHFIGLDHSQLNTEVLERQVPTCTADDLAGLPVMFPYFTCQAKSTAGLPMLAPDDLAWVTKLYPETVNAPPDRIPFNTVYGTIRGIILFSDGITHAKGLNVIAGWDGTLSRHAEVSVFSGYLFASWVGQSVTGGEATGSELGSRDPLLVGVYDMLVPADTYYVRVESYSWELYGTISSAIFPGIPSPGGDEYWNSDESASDSIHDHTAITISPGSEQNNVNIILNSTPLRFDSFESSELRPHEPLPAWLREDDWTPSEVAA